MLRHTLYTRCLALPNRSCQQHSHYALFHWYFQKYSSQNHICYHWLSVSGISKIMQCGILINMSLYESEHLRLHSSFIYFVKTDLSLFFWPPAIVWIHQYWVVNRGFLTTNEWWDFKSGALEQARTLKFEKVKIDRYQYVKVSRRLKRNLTP